MLFFLSLKKYIYYPLFTMLITYKLPSYLLNLFTFKTQNSLEFYIILCSTYKLHKMFLIIIGKYLNLILKSKQKPHTIISKHIPRHTLILIRN